MQSKERYYILPNQSLSDIPKDVNNLYLCGYDSGDNKRIREEFASYSFTQLCSITIGSGCFKNVLQCMLDGLGDLESVKIGRSCFFNGLDEYQEGIFRICNCPKLYRLEIDGMSFYNFSHFEISNVDSLEYVRIGGGCFNLANCILKGE